MFYLLFYNHFETQFELEQQAFLDFYTRDLNVFVHKTNNEVFFTQCLHEYREQLIKSASTSDYLLLDISGLKSQLPQDFTLITWDKDLIPVIEGSTGELKEQPYLATILISNILKIHDTFKDKYSSVFQLQDSSLYEHNTLELDFSFLFGEKFPYLDAFASFSTPFIHEEKKLFYWDFVNGRNNELGGFLAIIDLATIPATFAFDKCVEKEFSNTPEFAFGYHNEYDGSTSISDPHFAEDLKEMLAIHRASKTNPTFYKNWGLYLQPQRHSLPTKFVIFDISHLLKKNFQSKLWLIISVLAIFVVSALLMHRYYVLNKTSGISLRNKFIVLLFFSMLLPTSLLFTVTSDYIFSQSKVLKLKTQKDLQSSLKKIEFGLHAFYSGYGQNFAAFQKIFQSALPDLKQLPKSDELKRMMQEKKIAAFYILKNDSPYFTSNAIWSNDTDEFLDLSTLESILEEQPASFITNLHNISNISNSSDNENGSYFFFTNKTSEKYFVFEKHFIDASNDDYRFFFFTNKSLLDKEFLQKQVREHLSKDAQFFYVNLKDVSDFSPVLSESFRANLYPLVVSLQYFKAPDSELITDLDEKTFVVVNSSFFMAEHLIGFKTNWSELFSNLRKKYLYIFLTLLFGTMVSWFLLLSFLADLIEPVNILSLGARAITEGDFGLHINVASKDELGQLSSAFNYMTGCLRRRITELTLLNELSQKASISHNYREIFEELTTKLQDYLNAEDSGTAWISEEKEEELTLLANNMENSLSEFVLHVVSLSLKFNQTYTLQNDSLNKTVISVPFFYEDRKFGAMFLVFANDPDHFIRHLTSEEQSFIEISRQHVSLLIEKQFLFEQAITDSLTKLYLRRFFIATLDKELNRAKRYNLDLGIIMLDIDNFKGFNDLHGHQAGDIILKETAKKILESIRSVDTPTRYGGEEIAIILPQTKVSESFLVAERIRKTVEQNSITYDNLVLNVTVSLGVSSLEMRNDLTLEQLIGEADKALYTAKSNGKNQVVIATKVA